MAGSSSCTTRSSVARRRRPAPRSSSNHAARRAATAARVASVALGRCRSACHGWPPTRTLAVDRSPPIPGGARRRPRFGCMKHEPGGRFHVAATEDLITEQRQRRGGIVRGSCSARWISARVKHRVASDDAQRRRTSRSWTATSLHPRELPLHLKGTMTKRILVPVGQSESHATMSVVRGLARDQGSLVRLLRVVPVPELVMGRYGRTIAYVDQEMERLTAQGLEELMCPAAELEGVPGDGWFGSAGPVRRFCLRAMLSAAISLR